MNRHHSAELTQSLKDHGMDVKRASQLSDAFRLGWWAAEKELDKQRSELLDSLKVMHKIVDCMGDKPDSLISEKVWFDLKCEDAVTNSARAIFNAEK